MEGLKAALDTTKQIITLSTAVIALTVTFLEKIVQPLASGARHVPPTLKVSWIGFGLAILFAVWTLMAVTGTLNSLDRKALGLPLNAAQNQATTQLAEGGNIRIPALLMMVAFLFGAVLTIATGFYL
jgi:hypothetical protein